MRSFTVGNYRLDVVSHSRVFNPERFQGGVSEAFEVDCYDVSGREPVPFDWYPNADPHPHPDRPQRMVFIWTGKQFQPVFDDEGNPAGMKRGGDFRSRFWGSVVRRIRKAEAAARLGVTIGEVIDDALDKTAVAAPIDLKRDADKGRDRTLNEAVEALTGEAARVTTRIPRGTVANIDADFDSWVNTNGTEAEANTTNVLGISTFEYRNQYRFPLSSIADATAINDSDFQCNELSNDGGVDADDEVEFRDYGTSDPDTDSAATKLANSTGGTLYAVLTGFNTPGSKVVDLGSTADSDILARIGTPDRFTVALDPGTGFAHPNWCRIETIENSGTDPATLIVDYTEAAGAVVQDPIGPGIVAFAR